MLWVPVAAAAWRLDANGEARILAVALTPVLAWLLYAGVLVLRRPEQRGRSLGKELLGLRVVRMNGEPPSTGRVLFREVALKGYLFGPASLPLLGLPLLLDYLFPLVHHRNCTLHDLIADTIVVREVSVEAAVAAPSALAH